MFARGRDPLTGWAGVLRGKAQLTAMEVECAAQYVAANPGENGEPYHEFAHLEVAAVLGMSERMARDRLDLAVALTTRLPQTFAALRAGTIDEYRARRITEATAVLSDELALAVETEVVDRLGELSPRRVNRLLQRVVERVDRDGARARCASKTQQRKVEHWGIEDSAGIVQIQGDAERTQVAYDRISALARQIVTAGAAEGRTMDQIRSDVALDLLAGTDFENVNVHVWVTMPAVTTLGVEPKPGYLAGYGSIPADRALRLAAQEDATWQRILTEPTTGRVLDVGRRKYQPPAALRDHTHATFRTCTGPGCVRPAQKCDIDHATPFPLGPTSDGNTHPACRSHHRAKTFGGWTVDKPTPTTVTWTTPSGYQFTHHPEPIADPEPPPPVSVPDLVSSTSPAAGPAPPPPF